MEFKYKIIEHLGKLSTTEKGWSKELNLISWNEREPKYDIREWDATHEKMGKGITLTKDELDNLINVYKGEFNNNLKKFTIGEHEFEFIGNPKIKAKNNEFERIANLGDLFEILLRLFKDEFIEGVEVTKLIQISKVVSMLVFDLFGGEILSSNNRLDYHYNKINGEYVDMLSNMLNKREEDIDYGDSRKVEREILNYEGELVNAYKLLTDRIYIEE